MADQAGGWCREKLCVNPADCSVEDTRAVDRMVELERPTEEYYKLLRQDMSKGHPKVPGHVLDHLLSLEAFMDVSIINGFSFGVEKAQVMVPEGNLLGRKVGRSGVKGDEERSKAIRDFGALKNKKQVQQFAGSTNWLRAHLREHTCA